MPYQLRLPHVGESVTEAVMGPWLRAEGDRVEKYDPLVEIVTDKVTMEFPAPASGVLTRIVAQEGDTLPMGAVIAEMELDGAPPADEPEGVPEVIQEEGEAAGIGASAAGTLAPPPDRIGAMVMDANVGPTGGVFADTSFKPALSGPAPGGPRVASSSGGYYSPVVLRLAQEHGVDLATVTGSGIAGRVTKRDVLVAVEAGDAAPAAGAGGDAGGDREIEPSPIRKQIASHMEKSAREIPHAWTAVEADVSGLVEARARHRAGFKARHGVELTYLAFTLQTVALALRAHPMMNSSWVSGRIVVRTRVSVGIAVSSDYGLSVPVVHDADQEPVAGLALRLAPLVERARAGRLELSDVHGGTFTLNNTGALGSVLGGAIINSPQAAILTTEAIVRRPVAVTGPEGESIEVRPMMNLCLSFDHRVLDGAEAVAFALGVKMRLEGIDPEARID